MQLSDHVYSWVNQRRLCVSGKHRVLWVTHCLFFNFTYHRASYKRMAGRFGALSFLIWNTLLPPSSCLSEPVVLMRPLYLALKSCQEMGAMLEESRMCREQDSRIHLKVFTGALWDHWDNWAGVFLHNKREEEGLEENTESEQWEGQW